MSTEPPNSIGLIEHIKELRYRLLIVIAVWFTFSFLSYLLAENIYGFLVKPLANASDIENRRLIFTGLHEAFFTYIKLSLYSGFFLSFPIFAWQIYRFLSPGLYENEKKTLLPIIAFAPLLFYIGITIVYYLIFPLAWEFFLSFENNKSAIPIQLEARISEYLSLSLRLMLAFGLAFQLPIILIILAKAKIITAETLVKKRRYVIVGLVAIAAVITPPDIISQIGLAIPLYALYEGSILIIRKLYA